MSFTFLHIYGALRWRSSPSQVWGALSLSPATLQALWKYVLNNRNNNLFSKKININLQKVRQTICKKEITTENMKHVKLPTTRQPDLKEFHSSVNSPWLSHTLKKSCRFHIPKVDQSHADFGLSQLLDASTTVWPMRLTSCSWKLDITMAASQSKRISSAKNDRNWGIKNLFLRLFGCNWGSKESFFRNSKVHTLNPTWHPWEDRRMVEMWHMHRSLDWGNRNESWSTPFSMYRVYSHQMSSVTGYRSFFKMPSSTCSWQSFLTFWLSHLAIGKIFLLQLAMFFDQVALLSLEDRWLLSHRRMRWANAPATTIQVQKLQKVSSLAQLKKRTERIRQLKVPKTLSTRTDTVNSE